MNLDSNLCQNHKVPIYPKQINDICRSTRFVGDCPAQNASGRSASFVCGTYMQFELKMNTEARSIEMIRYKSNGCGFAVAAAEIIADRFQHLVLTDLHGITGLELNIANSLGETPCDRTHCIEVASEAFRAALADHRKRIIEEFHGEKALICTCFGVSEDLVASLIERGGITEVTEVAAKCNAGSGCGSCRMLIQEMIDSIESL